MPAISLSLAIARIGSGKEAFLRTLRVAESFADEIVAIHVGLEHAADVWNRCFAQAKADYILWLYPGETLAGEHVEKLRRLKETMPGDIDVALMGGQPRLVRRENRYTWFEPVRPYLQVWGKKIFTDITIQDAKKPWRPQETVQICENAMANGETLSSRTCYFYAQALKKCGREEEARRFEKLFLATC